MFESKDLADISAQLKALNYLMQELLRVLKDMNDRMPYCTCNDEHPVGATWACLFHGTVTKAQ